MLLFSHEIRNHRLSFTTIRIIFCQWNGVVMNHVGRNEAHIDLSDELPDQWPPSLRPSTIRPFHRCDNRFPKTFPRSRYRVNSGWQCSIHRLDELDKDISQRHLLSCSQCLCALYALSLVSRTFHLETVWRSSRTVLMKSLRTIFKRSVTEKVKAKRLMSRGMKKQTGNLFPRVMSWIFGKSTLMPTGNQPGESIMGWLAT